MRVPHNRLTHGETERLAVARVVGTGRWSAGPEVERLEAALARQSGARDAVCVGSGLAALRLALGALGVGDGDRVVVPGYSCVALANAALAWGALPSAADVRRDDWNLDPAATLEAVAATRARAVVAVHTFGAPAALEEIGAAGVPVVEDCSHAFGTAPGGGRPLGARTAVGVLSFHATKLLGAGEGGAVLTDSPEVAEFIRSRRDYADKPPDGRRLNDKMTELSACLALCQLDRLPDLLAARADRARRYARALAPAATATGAFRLPSEVPGRVWYRYSVELADREAEAVVTALESRGVSAARPVESWIGQGEAACPVAREGLRRVVSLPLYPTLTDEEQAWVIEAFLDVCGSS